jgi:hypothetical protein
MRSYEEVAMEGSDRGHGGALLVPFEAYGVRLLVSTNSYEVYERVSAMLPPGAIACPAEGEKHRLALDARADGTLGLVVDTAQVLDSVTLPLGLEALDRQIQAHVALDAPDRIFVHAGVVGLGESAIVIPGRSFTGKTTLVAEFVRAGAAYYSDEYAVLDEHGLVHPYPSALVVRGEDSQAEHSVVSLGRTAGERPLPVGTILVSTYRPGAQWRPSKLSAGEGVLAMLDNTVPARSRPAEALRAITRAVEGATVLEGDRGEASSVVAQLVAQGSA